MGRLKRALWHLNERLLAFWVDDLDMGNANTFDVTVARLLRVTPILRKRLANTLCTIDNEQGRCGRMMTDRKAAG